ncbi:hypothetical protein I7I50_08138 [Histoplasma capsulatum G186AR]|uniref:Uncharacterized protein n=1 Tax=Ajellomyces capsulatus TaxID=5037 RepID=A0A8H7YJY8_AJECA|nr:hypothetical protein I7I52_08654 [Histoplasma capsulatum]QSS68656.1 hypothetical protein I7I50_08138 [Histoplasma capsulatum G186AR]
MPLKGSSVFGVVSNEVVTSRVRNWATAEAFYFKDAILPTRCAITLRYRDQQDRERNDFSRCFKHGFNPSCCRSRWSIPCGERDSIQNPLSCFMSLNKA